MLSLAGCSLLACLVEIQPLDVGTTSENTALPPALIPNPPESRTDPEVIPTVPGVVPEAPEPVAPVEPCSEASQEPFRTIVFPTGSGVVDVTSEPYNAVGDGQADDTAAIQQALDDHVGTGRIIYLPAGTFLISDTLSVETEDAQTQPSLTIQGGGATETTLRLAPSTPGFGDPESPKAMLYTGVQNRQGSGGPVRRLHLFDMQVLVEDENPGAIGVDFTGHDRSGIENVIVTSTGGAGVMGIRLERPWAGSRMVRNVEVHGFDIGIGVAEESFSNTFEYVTLNGQNQIGFRNNRGFVSIRRLQSNNAVPAVQNVHALGMVVLLEASLFGGTQEHPAIDSEGELFLRDIVTEGYLGSARLRGKVVVEGDAGEFTSRDPSTLYGSGAQSLGLPIEDAPALNWPPLEDWTNVADFGALPQDGVADTEAIQDALSSGASHVYVPFGRYRLTDTLQIPPTLEALVGMESTLLLRGDILDPDRDAALINVEADSESPFRITRFEFSAPDDAVETPLIRMMDHSSTRTVIIDKVDARLRSWSHIYRGFSEAGDAFIQNVHAGGVELAAGQNAWLRATNFEHQNPMIDNDGAQLWALGMKAWSPNTAIKTSNGGRTELLGGFLIPGGSDTTPPAFVSEDSETALVFATIGPEGSEDYEAHVVEMEAGNELTLEASAVRVLGSGSYVPLHVGHDREVRVCNEP